MSVMSDYKVGKYTFLTVKNSSGLEVTFCDLGASIFCMKFNHEVMTLTPKHEEDFFATSYYAGKSIGRVANRIEKGKVTIDEVTYQVDLNDGENTLHGGKNGLSTKKWEYAVKEVKKGTKVSFRYTSKHLDGGLPGKVRTKVEYLISEDKPEMKLTVTYRSDRKTPYSFTNHTQFCLGDKNLCKIGLKINASTYNLINNKNLLQLRKVSVPSCLDFRRQKRIMRDINDPLLKASVSVGYDYFFNFDSKPGKIKLSNDHYELNVSTDFPGVQCYSHNFPANVPFLNDNDDYRGSLAIEPSLNLLDDILLEPNVNYRHVIKYSFKIK